jgi:hypothetical protein
MFFLSSTPISFSLLFLCAIGNEPFHFGCLQFVSVFESSQGCGD